jgi:outer membrane protein TolC
MLPNIDAVGGITGSVQDTKTKFATGDEQNVKGAGAFGLNAAVQLDWVLFDGMRMFINKRRLEALQYSGEIALKRQIQQTVANVIYTYADVVRQKQKLIAIDTALTLAKTRMDISRKKFEVGTSAKTDYLQAQVDYNASRSDFLQQEAQLRSAKDSLMILLGRNQFADFEVQDSLSLNKNLSFSMQENWLADNFDYQLALQNKNLSEYDLKLARGAQLPQVNLFAAYSFTRNQNAAGFSLFNRNLGPEAGLNFRVPLFEGLNLQREKKIARQEVFRKDLLLEQIAVALAGSYRSQWRNYDNALKTLSLEQENLDYARENVMIQQARFRVGVAGTLEMREAENSYVAALTRLVEAAYAVKIAGTKLLQIENRLLN